MSSHSERVKAVMERDTRYDGVFVYGVKSTGIYCRPSCSSRRPKPENIEIFDTPEEAEAAGYRACLRCNPSLYLNPNEVFVERITSYIAAQIDDEHTLQSFADEFGVSKYHLQRTFKSVLGVSPRIQQTQQALREGT